MKNFSEINTVLSAEGGLRLGFRWLAEGEPATKIRRQDFL